MNFNYAADEPEETATSEGMPEPVEAEEQHFAPARDAVEEANFQNMLRDTDAAAADETVTVRYVGKAESFDTKGLGVFNAGEDYEVNPRCARRLLELRNPDGTKAFKAV